MALIFLGDATKTNDPLLQMLDTLFANTDPEERIRKLKNDFHVPMVDSVIKEVRDMYGIAAAIGQKYRKACETAMRGFDDEKQRADDEKQRADNAEQELKNERQRADDEKQRADDEKQRADELDAKYKALIETLQARNVLVDGA